MAWIHSIAVGDVQLRYGVRCHVVGNIPFTWRDDTKVLSAEDRDFLSKSSQVAVQELFTMRRSMDVKEFVKLINKHGVSWNLEEQEMWLN